MRKKIMLSIGMIVVIAASIALGAYAASDIKLMINGKEIKTSIITVDGFSYVPLRVVSETLGADINWDSVTRTITITSKTTIEALDTTPTPEHSKTTIDSKLDLIKYLDDNFSTLKTSIGDTSFTFSVYENESIFSPFDYRISVDYDLTFFNDMQYSIKLSSDQREKVKLELKNHQEKLAKAVIELMPTKKITGGYSKSWYRYPELQIDLIMRNYYTWTNYEEPDLFSKNEYEDTIPSSFRWFDLIDDQL